MDTSLILMQAPAGGANMWSTILMMVAIFVVFYLFMIRPQQKKQKEIEKARASMQKGDQVITSGGIYGKISKIAEDHFEIEIDNNVHIKVDKSSVYQVTKK